MNIDHPWIALTAGVALLVSSVVVVVGLNVVARPREREALGPDDWDFLRGATIVMSLSLLALVSCV